MSLSSLFSKKPKPQFINEADKKRARLSKRYVSAPTLIDASTFRAQAGDFTPSRPSPAPPVYSNHDEDLHGAMSSRPATGGCFADRQSVLYALAQLEGKAAARPSSSSSSASSFRVPHSALLNPTQRERRPNKLQKRRPFSKSSINLRASNSEQRVQPSVAPKPTINFSKPLAAATTVEETEIQASNSEPITPYTALCSNPQSEEEREYSVWLSDGWKIWREQKELKFRMMQSEQYDSASFRKVLKKKQSRGGMGAFFGPKTAITV